MPPIGGQKYLAKNGENPFYYEIFDKDCSRVDFGYIIYTDFKDILKRLYRKYGFLRIETIDGKLFHIIHPSDIDKLIIEDGELVFHKISSYKELISILKNTSIDNVNICYDKIYNYIYSFDCNNYIASKEGAESILSGEFYIKWNGVIYEGKYIPYAFRNEIINIYWRNNGN